MFGKKKQFYHDSLAMHPLALYSQLYLIRNSLIFADSVVNFLKYISPLNNFFAIKIDWTIIFQNLVVKSINLKCLENFL